MLKTLLPALTFNRRSPDSLREATFPKTESETLQNKTQRDNPPQDGALNESSQQCICRVCLQGFAGRVLLAGFCLQGFVGFCLQGFAGFCLQGFVGFCLQGFACRVLSPSGRGFCFRFLSANEKLSKEKLQRKNLSGFACRVLPAGFCPPQDGVFVLDSCLQTRNSQKRNFKGRTPKSNA